jgi:release factor glutamine methyltransferase
LAQPHITITSEQKQSINQWIGRIIEHNEPIQYIIGTMPFGNLTLHVEHPVLIPRPETEEWVHAFIARCKQKNVDSRVISILDIGTGSGCIALTIAHHLPLATVIAVDTNPMALQLAKKNAQKNSIKNVHFIESDLFGAIPQDVQFDVIISNPPYISIEDFLTLDCSVTAWEDCNALVAEDDGFACLEAIATQAISRLKKQVEKKMHVPEQLLLEIGYQQAERMVDFLQNIGFSDVQVYKDSAGRDRLISAMM